MRITFELIGGPMNGVFLGTLDGPSTVRVWYDASDGGTVGNEFLVQHQSAIGHRENHRYLVTDCERIDGTVKITAIHERAE